MRNGMEDFDFSELELNPADIPALPPKGAAPEDTEPKAGLTHGFEGLKAVRPAPLPETRDLSAEPPGLPDSPVAGREAASLPDAREAFAEPPRLPDAGGSGGVAQAGSLTGEAGGDVAGKLDQIIGLLAIVVDRLEQVVDEGFGEVAE